MSTAPKNESPAISLEVCDTMPSNAIESITRGEIDIQIATAKKFPRSMAQFKRDALEMVSMDEETAASCIYRRPVGKDPETGQQKYAEGLSVRMAEIVAACYGNVRYGAFLVEQTERSVKARGFCHDVQKNVAATSEAVESTVKKNGQPFDERMRIVVAKAALSKAKRDALFTVVPRALCRSIEEEAKRVAIGDAKTLSSRRDAALKWCASIGVLPPRVCAALGVKGVDDIGLDQLETLTGLKTSIKDGDVTVEDAFPNAAPEIKKPMFKEQSATSKPEGQAAPAREGVTQAQASDEAPEPPTSPNYVKGIQGLLKAAKLEEKDLLAYLFNSGDAYDRLRDVPGDTLKDLYDRWQYHEKEIRTLKEVA